VAELKLIERTLESYKKQAEDYYQTVNRKPYFPKKEKREEKDGP
jgi:hypothetical protein